MSSGSIRIIQLPEKSSVNTDDYMAVDSSANGTKKIKFTDLLDNNLSAQNKAADASATGQAISELNTDINNTNIRIDNMINTQQNASVTTLWTGTLNTKNQSVTLSQSIANFDFVDIYIGSENTVFARKPVSSSVVFQIQTQNMSDDASVQFLRWYETGLTISGTTATINKAIRCYWDDFSTQPVVAQATDGVPAIIRIDGVKIGHVENDEIVDARVGADGITYLTLGNAIRNQFINVKKNITDMGFIVPKLRNGSMGNTGNVNRIACNTVLPTNGAKRIRLTMTVPLSADDTKYLWGVNFYSQSGGASSSTTYRTQQNDNYLWTKGQSIEINVEGKQAFAFDIYEANASTPVAHRIANDGDCINVEYLYDESDYVVPSVNNGSMGNPNNQNMVKMPYTINIPKYKTHVIFHINNKINQELQFKYSLRVFGTKDCSTYNGTPRVYTKENVIVEGNSFVLALSELPPNAESFGIDLSAKLNGTTYALRYFYVEDIFSIEFIDIPQKEDAYVRNKDKDAMLACATRFNKKGNNVKDFCMLEITDSHNDIVATNNSVVIANGFDYIDTLIHCGDICASTALQFDPISYENMIMCKKPFYFVIGNHDVGNSKTISNCLNNADAFTRYIQPLIDAGLLLEGEYENGKNYYYHDFADYNIRLICVYEYDDPNDIDSNQSTKYRITRGDSVISEEQAKWFCDTLISTPSGYSVIVAMHNPFSDIAESDISYKFTQSEVTGSAWSQRLFSTDFWADAINAFVNKTSYTCDMVCTGDASYLNNVETGKYYSFTKDFTNVNGKFLCFIGGHGHRDEVFVHPNYSYMKQITPLCANTINYQQSINSDIRRTFYDSPSKDSLTAIGCDTENNKLRLVKIGVNVTENMAYRDMEVIDC